MKKQKWEKRLMKKFIVEGELEKAAFIWSDVPDADPDRGCGNAAEK